MSTESLPPIRQMMTFLPVRDLARSLAFSRTNFGLAPAYQRPGVAILEVRPDSFLGLAHKPDRPADEKTITFSFVVEDAAAWSDALTAAGVITKGPPVFKPEFGINIVYATDPDGHTIEVLEMCDAGWPHSH